MLLVLLIACSGDTEYPLDRTDAGLGSLTWGMDPDTAVQRMLGMPGIVRGEDTVVTFGGEYYPSFHVWDSVEINERPAPVQRRQIVNLSGGTFLGQAVSKWALEFEDAAGLLSVNVTLAAYERNNRRYTVMQSLFRDRYRFEDYRRYGIAIHYSSHSIAGTPDTSKPADTFLTLENLRNSKRVLIRYRDKAGSEAEMERLRNNKRIMVSKQEWEEMEKEL
jgi:hypothetical protein